MLKKFSDLPNSLAERAEDSLTFDDLRYMCGIGESISSGSGRNKEYGYRNSVKTKIGNIEENHWCQLMEQLIERSGEAWILEALIEWEKEHNYRKTSSAEMRRKALEAHSHRIFDDPQWVCFIPFNRRYRPDALEYAHIVWVVNECCALPGEVTQEQIDRSYAKINSLTNSVYALIYNEASLADTAGKWYEGTVNEMVSRKIINGYSDGTFRGADSITRAEFAAIVIRALGLPANGSAKFSDVRGTEWFVGSVGAAVEYGIVYGYGDGSFRPNANITRQEAMAMVARAAEVAEFTGQSTNDLSAFSDTNKVGAWALEYVQFNVGSGLIVGNNGQLKPRDNISRAETATVILRLLQKSGLVDVRSKA